MAERLTRLEAEMGQFSRAMNAIPSSIRMTVNAYVTESINRKYWHLLIRKYNIKHCRSRD